MLFFRKKTFTGLDIGTSSLKIIQIRDAKEMPFKFYVRNIQYSDREDPAAHQVEEAISEISEEIKNFGDSLSFGLQGVSVITRYIEIPKISSKELGVALPIEAKKFIPFPIEEVELSYSVLPPLSRDAHRMGVTFVGVPRSVVRRYENLLKNVNVKSSSFEPLGFATVRAFKISKQFRRGESVMLINVGTKYTNISISLDGNLYLTRDFTLGGRDFTRMLISNENPDYQKAEVEKRTRVMFSKDGAHRYIASTVAEWVREILDTIDFYENKMVEEQLEINRVLLYGGGALMRGFPEFLQRKLSKPVEVDRELPGTLESSEDEKALKGMGTMLKPAFGLALKAREELT